jgi:phenylalanyl-tRNA synthetase alpha chain
MKAGCMVELRTQEQRLLSALESLGGKASAEQLIDACGFPDTAVMRTALTLQEKNLISIHAEYRSVIKLTAEGEQYAKNGLPERKLIHSVAALGGMADLKKATHQAGIEPQFIQIALGWVIRKKWALYTSSDNTIRISETLLHQAFIAEGCDETLLKYLNDKHQAAMEDLSPELKEAAEQLKKRTLVTIEPKTTRTLQITPQGAKALVKNGSADSVFSVQVETPEVIITQLTPQDIITGKWHTSKLQKYNIEAPVAKAWPGKKHPYLQFLDEVRAKLVQLGFQEMTGTAVETSFFNFDALYVPQDHPAREPSDIYYIKDPQYGEIGQHGEAVEHVAETHENGWITGSTGWGYKYSLLAAQRLILRGHGTCLSARTLESKNYQVPSKHFSIARVYRPEITDKTHLSEFNQVEGIIIDENLTLKDLLGVLGKFAMEIAGADKVCFKPDYFPFTEPSVELSAFKEGYGWVEFGGSGIFRPEVTLPLGVKEPVIAWGLGVDRLFMMHAGIEDIRMIFSQDLDWLRKKQVT